VDDRLDPLVTLADHMFGTPIQSRAARCASLPLRSQPARIGEARDEREHADPQEEITRQQQLAGDQQQGEDPPQIMCRQLPQRRMLPTQRKGGWPTGDGIATDRCCWPNDSFASSAMPASEPRMPVASIGSSSIFWF